MHHNRKFCACNNIFTVSNILSFVNTFVFYIPLQLNVVRKSLYKKTSMYLCISSAHLWKAKTMIQRGKEQIHGETISLFVKLQASLKLYIGHQIRLKTNRRKGSLQRYSDGQDPSFCSKFLVMFLEVNLFLNKSYSLSLPACNKTYLIFRTQYCDLVY